jgi:hypothetical protein
MHVFHEKDLVAGIGKGTEDDGYEDHGNARSYHTVTSKIVWPTARIMTR